MVLMRKLRRGGTGWGGKHGAGEERPWQAFQGDLRLRQQAKLRGSAEALLLGRREPLPLTWRRRL